MEVVAYRVRFSYVFNGYAIDRLTLTKTENCYNWTFYVHEIFVKSTSRSKILNCLKKLDGFFIYDRDGTSFRENDLSLHISNITLKDIEKSLSFSLRNKK